MPTKPKYVSRPWVIKRDTKGNKPQSMGRNKMSDMHSFYNDKRWRATRLYYIQRNPLCKTCSDNDRVVSGEVVDHILPIRQGGDQYTDNNLQTLCKKCHDKKSRQDATTIVYTPHNMVP